MNEKEYKEYVKMLVNRGFLYETEKAFDVMGKFVEITNEFLMSEDIKPLYQKFLIEKASK